MSISSGSTGGEVLQTVGSDGGDCTGVRTSRSSACGDGGREVRSLASRPTETGGRNDSSAPLLPSTAPRSPTTQGAPPYWSRPAGLRNQVGGGHVIAEYLSDGE